MQLGMIGLGRMGANIVRRLLRNGEVVQQGAPSVCWLGVPLKTQERTVGMLAAQSYE